MNKGIYIEKPKFDINFYTHMIKKTVYSNSMDNKSKEIKLKLLVERAYEEGLQHGKF